MSVADGILIADERDPETTPGISLTGGYGIEAVGRALLAALSAHPATGLIAALLDRSRALDLAPAPTLRAVAAHTAEPAAFPTLWLVCERARRILVCVADRQHAVWREVAWIGVGEPVDWGRLAARAAWGPHQGVRVGARSADSSNNPETTRVVRVCDGERVFFVEIADADPRGPARARWAVCDCGREECRHVATALRTARMGAATS